MDECSICLEEMKTDLVMLRCFHRFHTKCFLDYVASIDEHPVCPLCRAKAKLFIRFDYRLSKKGKSGVRIPYIHIRDEKRDCCILS